MAAKLRVLRNLTLGTGAGLGVLYAWDQAYNRRAVSRTFYALYNATVIAVDYKYSFREGHDIQALHERSARRLYDVIVSNKGLYVKLGQSIAVQGSMLPAPYRILLSRLFDDAPQDSWEECHATLTAELGRDPSEVFESIDPTAVASASIAQVHRATLRGSGTPVAVKIQHADIPVSTFWDLTTYRVLMWVFDRVVFRMPLSFVANYIADQVAQETDFRIEIENARTMRALVEADPETRGRVYVPDVYPELSTRHMLVMEWIEGVSLSRRPDVEAAGYNVKQALTTVFKILTKEAFEWGVVHSDPHPGNWILRRDPRAPRRQQLVMLDHGLYVHMGEQLRTQYVQLWRAMFHRDLDEITRITQAWGFGDAKLFASATMLQPYDDDALGKNDFRDQEARAEQLREFLKDTSKIPLSLVFVGRTQRILQNLNQIYGSPVNRLHILVEEALKLTPADTSRLPGLPGHWRFPLITRVIEWVYRRILLLATDLVFLGLRIRQSFTKEDPEEALEASLQRSSTALLK